MSLYHKGSTQVWNDIDSFTSFLKAKVRSEDKYIKENLIENGKKTITLFAHEAKINEITEKYLK